METISATNTFTQRMMGALALDAAIYEEVEADPSSLNQAAIVVLASSVAAGIGSRGLGGTTLRGMVFISVVSLLAWAAWALVVVQIGGRVMPEPTTRVDVGQLLRTIGFASAPGLLRVLGVMSAATIPVFAITAVWMLAAMIVAVRQALDFHSTARAVTVCVLGWALAIAVALVIGLAFGPTVS